MHHPIRWLSVTCALNVVACASIAPGSKDQDVLEHYVRYADAPVQHFTYLGRFDSWRALSQSELVVWTTPNDAYLLSVVQPCIGLQFANRIGVSSTAGTVDRGLDSVLVDRQRCPIAQIRRIDYRRMRADRRNAAH